MDSKVTEDTYTIWKMVSVNESQVICDVTVGAWGKKF